MSEIKAASFRGGIHPLHDIGSGKRLTSGAPLEKAAPPKLAVYPMAQHIGAPCKPCVAVGDRVLIGQVIGEPGGFVSAPVHASVSGTVKAIERRLAISGSPVNCVIIENDFADEWSPDITERAGVDELEPQDIVEIVKGAGIVGLGGAAFPTHVKLMPSKDTPVDTLIINGAECEPYLTTNHRRMVETPELVVSGALLLKKALKAKRAVIGIEDNKPDAIAAMRAAARDGFEVVKMKTKYPQGSEKHLITALTGRQVPSGKLPAAAGCVVCNVSTALAVHDAVYHMRPITEATLTVTGEVAHPCNLIARVGTPVSELIAAAGGLLDGADRVLAGGPMMGIAIYDLSVPVQKSTSGLLALRHERPAHQTACLRCGRCAAACPMRLMPMLLNKYSTMQRWDLAEEHDVLDCIECGSCEYSCPAKLDLTTNIRVAKRAAIAARKR